jgi:hypothetical protein
MPQVTLCTIGVQIFEASERVIMCPKSKITKNGDE